jgi:hypothetical protein
VCVQMVACFARLPGTSLPAGVRRRRQCLGMERWAPLTVKSGIRTWAGRKTKQDAGLMHEHASMEQSDRVKCQLQAGPQVPCPQV